MSLLFFPVIYSCPLYAVLQANATDATVTSEEAPPDSADSTAATNGALFNETVEQAAGENTGKSTAKTAGVTDVRAELESEKGPDGVGVSEGGFEHRPVGEGASESGDVQLAKKKTPSGLPSPVRSLISLAGVLGLMFAVAWLFKRFVLGDKSTGGGSIIEVLARSPVNPKQSLCLVKLDRRVLLVGLSPNHIAPLYSFEDPDEIARIMGMMEKQSVHSISSTFDRFFHQEAQEYDDSKDFGDGYNMKDFSGGESFDDKGKAQPQRWNAAQHELSSLLSKVKGLTRMKMKV